MPTIVIVDDSAANIMIYTKLSESIDHPEVTVQAFRRPQQAIAWLTDNTADLIITDFKMPAMTGAALTRVIRTIPGCADTPIVVATAYDDRAIRIEALEAGATDFLLTPVDHAEFLPRVRNLLRLSAHQRRARERAAELETKLEASERWADQMIRNSREQLLQVIDSVPAIISAVSSAGLPIFSNAYHGKCCGHARVGGLTALDRRIIATGETSDGFEETITDGAGQARVFFVTKSPLREPDGAVSGVITTALDITERKAAEMQLLYQVEHDPLTAIPNRYFINSWITAEIERNRDSRRPFALYYVDLDRFKTVNDELGHHYGDRLLQAVSQRLKAVIRREDVVARLGGDEFAIIQIGTDRESQTRTLAQRITRVLEEPFLIDDQVVTISASVGVTLYPNDGVTVEELLNNADLAMYRVKAGGRNNVEFFNAAMRDQAQEVIRTRAMLRGALERGEFFLVYQPQRDLRSDQVVGFEALIRWQQTADTVALPGTFLSIAEESGLMPAIDNWVLRTACIEARRWFDIQGKPCRVAINLSAQSFHDPGFSDRVCAVLAETGVPPGLLELELTEGIMINGDQRSIDQLEAIHRIGVRIAIDDFGTGYSELARLSYLPIDLLKIDRTFIATLDSRRSEAIVTAIIGLARTLNVEVLAEGVETLGQVSGLRSLGCDLVQGYVTGYPMDRNEVLRDRKDVAFSDRGADRRLPVLHQRDARVIMTG
ncbi:GGDEF/EAL domain-containing response regulator [Acidiphilium sp.]|uniref:GGDEF/EAL domain-containing response regulator n=1 Tax=Acidiphilium sp. TaxID=527 RepID=UPI003CFF75BC